DQLGVLRQKLRDEEADVAETRRLKTQSRRKIDLIGKDLRELPDQSTLGGLMQRYRLNKHQFVVLLTLLRQRLTADNPYLKGRELLGLLFDSSYEILRGCDFLEPTATLLSAGLIVPDTRDDGDEDEVLETPFKISDRVFRMVRNTFLAQRAIRFPGKRNKVRPYRNNLSYVLDVRRFSLLYRKRAAKVFQFDYWDDVGLGTAESVTALNQQLRRFRDRMAESLRLTPRADEFPLVSMRKEYGLDEQELVVLITLLFQELLEGGAFLDAVDLLKLISANEEELVAKRRFLSRRSTLVKANLVAIEEMSNDKELTAEVYLPNWVVDRMLGEDGRRRIDADVRLDFHDYLEQLGSSETFFEDLDLED
ncbi:MAG: hypothetical protein V2A76_03970, partial [Planctomycetota bacterium]